MRICSLLPSATEIVFALGQGDALVGVTHECDYPPEAARIPKVTRTNIAPGLSSRAIDAAVSSTLTQTGSLYELDLPLLDRLAPNLILTQQLCDVCAVSFDRVERSAGELASQPVVLNLEPHSLDDILGTIRTVGEAIGCRAAADTVIAGLRQRIDAVAEKARALPRRRVVCLEWVDPPYCAGHWMPELVELAGGRDALGRRHEPSARIEWQQVLDYAPEMVVLTCCGFDLARCEQEAELLPPACSARVFATDGSAYFSRPGPRIVESLEILAHLIHPEAFPAPALRRAFAQVRIAAPVGR